MKKLFDLLDEYGIINKDKNKSWHFKLQGYINTKEYNLLEKYLDNDCIVAELSNEFGTIILIKSIRKYMTFFIKNDKIRLLDYSKSVVRLEDMDFYKLTKQFPKILKIHNEKGYNLYLKKIMLIKMSR